MYQLNLPINTLSAAKGSPYRDELLKEGGKIQTPCLRIENEGKFNGCMNHQPLSLTLNNVSQTSRY